MRIDQRTSVIDETIVSGNHLETLPLGQTLAIHLYESELELKIDKILVATIGLIARLLMQIQIGLIVVVEIDELLVGKRQVAQQHFGIVFVLALKVVAQRHVTKRSLLFRRHVDGRQKNCGGQLGPGGCRTGAGGRWSRFLGRRFGHVVVVVFGRLVPVVGRVLVVRVA